MLILFTVGCATSKVTSQDPADPLANTEANRVPAEQTPISLPQQAAPEPNKVMEDANPILAEITMEAEKVPHQIPLELNRKVAEWIDFFTIKERDLTQRYLERGEALRPHIEQILKENDVPPELFYLAMIESGFVSHAKSRAKAVGIWQFMAGTAKNYGLAVNKQSDERKNWVKATEAAASYLKDLNNVFGSWYLALAAYNAGEHRIVRSIMRGKTRDFWALAEAGLLPRETLNYVPKFLAAHIVGKHFKKFGFDIKPDAKWEEFDTISVPSGVRIADLAKVSGVSQDSLKRWNLDLIKGVTPQAKVGTVEIYVPKDEVQKIELKRAEITKLKRYKSGPMDQRSFASTDSGGAKNYNVYIVRHGETLKAISRRFGLSVRTMMKINGLRRARIHPGQRLRYYSPANSPQKSAKSVLNSRSVATEKF